MSSSLREGDVCKTLPLDAQGGFKNSPFPRGNLKGVLDTDRASPANVLRWFASLLSAFWATRNGQICASYLFWVPAFAGMTWGVRGSDMVID